MSDELLSECHDALEQDPANLVLLANLIELCREAGRPEDCRQRLWAAARHCEQRGDAPKAIWLLRRLVELDPGETRNLAWLAQLWCKLSLREVGESTAALFRKRGDFSGLVAWVLQMGAKVRVRGPADLRARVRSVLEAALAQAGGAA